MEEYNKIHALSILTFHHLWRENSPDTGYLPVESYLNSLAEIADKCSTEVSIWKAVRCRQLLYRKYWRRRFEEDIKQYVPTIMDSYLYIVETLNIYAEFDDVLVADKIFLSCAFVAELTEFHATVYGSHEYFNMCPTIWALYFEVELLDEFHTETSWEDLVRNANSFNYLYVYLDSIWSNNQQENSLISLKEIIEELERYKVFVTPNLSCENNIVVQRKPFAKYYDDYYKTTLDIANEFNYLIDEIRDVYETIDTVLLRLRYLCDPHELGAIRNDLLCDDSATESEDEQTDLNSACKNEECDIGNGKKLNCSENVNGKSEKPCVINFKHCDNTSEASEARTPEINIITEVIKNLKTFFLSERSMTKFPDDQADVAIEEECDALEEDPKIRRDRKTKKNKSRTVSPKHETQNSAAEELTEEETPKSPDNKSNTLENSSLQMILVLGTRRSNVKTTVKVDNDNSQLQNNNH